MLLDEAVASCFFNFLLPDTRVVLIEQARSSAAAIKACGSVSPMGMTITFAALFSWIGRSARSAMIDSIPNDNPTVGY
ncbi:hypothetical protein D3C71_1724350 [compost metagenome]